MYTQRSLVSSDLPQMLAVYDSANLLFEPHLRSKGAIEHLPRPDEHSSWGIFKAEVLIAWCCWKTHPGWAFLSGMYVAKTDQRQGLGQQLISNYHQSLPISSYSVLSVLKQATWAHKFYLHQGYQPLSQPLAEGESVLSKVLECHPPEPWALLLYHTIKN